LKIGVRHQFSNLPGINPENWCLTPIFRAKIHCIMISYQDALRQISAVCQPLESSPTPLDELLGRAPVEDVRSKMNVPSFANSAMDGFAMSAAVTARAGSDTPVEIPVTGVVAAGQEPPEGIKGQAVEIMTGAPIPAGYDTVIPVERIEAKRDSDGTATLISCTEPVPPNQHVREASQDFRLGQKIFTHGHLLEPHHIMGLAATGTDVVETHRKPKVALITTGSELAMSGVPSGGGLIRDANSPYLSSFLTATNTDLVRTDFVTDDPNELHTAIKACSDNTDIILTTGGVSAGRFDLVPDAIKTLGGETLFHKVAMRPGKPLLFARLDKDTLFFGLPGNPIAVAVGLRFFVLPALRHLQGLVAEQFLPTTCAEPVSSKPGMTFFGKARTEPDENGCLRTRLLPGQESFKINSLMQANCWAIVPEGTADVAAGECIEIAPLYPNEFLR
jgi:molybdopterin molybdotransferase